MVARVKILFEELRAEFLTASVLPVLLGTSIAYMRTGNLDGLAFLLTILAVVLVHLGTNVSNDYFDHQSGNDWRNTEFVRPFTGGSRLIQKGLLEPREVFALSVALFSSALAAGIALAVMRGPIIILLGATGIAAGFFYSAPPLKLAARGIGEIIIGLSFGVLCTMGAYYVQAREVTLESLVASLPLAILISAVVFINEFQDMKADAESGKKTIVVRLGRKNASIVFAAMMFSAFVPIIAGCAVKILPPLTILALVVLPFAVGAAAIARNRYDSPQKLAPANGLTIATHALTGIIMAASYFFSR